MKNPTLVKSIQPLFNNGLYRVYTNLDVVGCELGGVLKNIIAIAVGMGDGLGAGDNTRASLITRGLAEITRLGVAMGGEPHFGTGRNRRPYSYLYQPTKSIVTSESNLPKAKRWRKS